MNKKYLLLILLVLSLSISAVSASQNITFSDDVISVEEYDGNVLNDGDSVTDDLNSNNESNSSFDETNSSQNTDFEENVSQVNQSYILQGEDLNEYYDSNPTYKFKLLDFEGNPVAGSQVKLELNGKIYNKKTNAKGVGSLKIKLQPGKYTVNVYYGNESIKNDIVLFSYKVISAKNISSVYGTSVKYSLKVADNFNEVKSGVNVRITIGKKVYNLTTDSKGIVNLNLNYNAGKYIINYAVGNAQGSNSYSVSNKISFKILKWGNVGDVSKIKLIKNNMPNNKWVKKAVSATKQGIPLLKFKGGSGKIVFITAGVHGNELSSQVAAMKLIKYLSDKPIKGTVYVIPFVNLKAISQKVRYTDKDYNRIASQSGTISNKIVKLVVKYKADYYGDFHTTQPGGIPGKNVVMGSKTPNLKSYKLTNYIAKKANVNKIVYNYAGQKYPGAIADNVNNKGIPAVLCEVMLPHNTVTTKTVNLSLLMMKYLLKYSSVI